MNKERLKSVMALHSDTSKGLAEYLGISEQSVSAKINEKGSEFKQKEIAAIKARYNLTPEQIDSIFFDA